MKCNLVVETAELVVREYSNIEHEGLKQLTRDKQGIRLYYEDEYELPYEFGGYTRVIVIAGKDLTTILLFIASLDIPVKIIY